MRKGRFLDTITSLRGQLTQAHEIMEQAVADLSPEQLNHRGEGWTIQSIAGIYAHTVSSEDYMVNMLLRDQPTFVFESGGWAEKTGYNAGTDGLLSEKVSAAASTSDFGALREYAQAVYADTDAWLATLSEADLDRTIHVEWAGGDVSVGQFLGTVIVWHPTQHGGEICALKGVQGEKGLPF